MVDYTMVDYTMVDYTMVDYTMVDYTMVDYTQGSIFQECKTFLEDQQKNADPEEGIILNFIIKEIEYLHQEMGKTPRYYTPPVQELDARRESKMIRLRDLAYGMLSQKQYFAIARWCWFAHIPCVESAREEYISIGNLALKLGKERGDTQLDLLFGVPENNSLILLRKR